MKSYRYMARYMATAVLLAFGVASATSAQTTASLRTAAGAKTMSGVQLQLAPGSNLTLTGTSTLHGFTCTTHDLQAFISVDSSYATAALNTIAHPIVSVRIVIPVKSLACGGELDGNMLKTLRVKDYPTITYVLN